MRNILLATFVIGFFLVLAAIFFMSNKSKTTAEVHPDFGNASFVMEIHDIFTIENVGIAITGNIEHGIVHQGSDVAVVDSTGNVLYRSLVSWLDSMDTPEIKSASVGDNVALMFTDTEILRYVNSGLYIIIE